MIDITENGEYYIPTKEELVIGMEYQFLDPGMESSTPWTDAVIVDGTQIDDITREFDGAPTYLLRVRLLCHHDIVSLLWKQSGALSDRYFMFNVNNENYVLVFSANNVWIERFDLLDDGINPKRTFNHLTLFKGVLRNRSELSVLMRQLGITAQ